MTDWIPKSLLLLRHYRAADLVADLIAGVTVGLVALPLAMAFAISSGLSPQAGLYCAVVTALQAGARRIALPDRGPIGAFVVVVALSSPLMASRPVHA
jgi:SulP family sulfate permease